MENFSIRTQYLLMNAGIKSLQELSEYTAADLLKFRNFGYKSLQEVEPYLKTFDFTIKSDNTETLANALKQIEKLEADKAELLDHLQDEINEFSVLGYEPSQYQLGYNSAINDIMEILKPTPKI